MDAEVSSDDLERGELHPRGTRGNRRASKSKIRSVKETIERVKERYRRAEMRTRGFGRRGGRGGIQPGRGSKKRGTRGRGARGGRTRSFNRRNEYVANDRSHRVYDRERDNEDFEKVYQNSPSRHGYREEQSDDDFHKGSPENYDSNFKEHFKERSTSLDRGQRESYEKDSMQVDRDSEDDQRYEEEQRIYEKDWQDVQKERRELEDLRKAVEEERQKLELIKRKVIEEEGDDFEARSPRTESNSRFTSPGFIESSKETFSEKVMSFNRNPNIKKPLLKAPPMYEVLPSSSNMPAAGILSKNTGSDKTETLGSDEVHPSSNRMTAAGLLQYLAKSSARNTKSHNEAPVREVDSTNRVRSKEKDFKNKLPKVDFDIMGGPRISGFNVSKNSGVDMLSKRFNSAQEKAIGSKSIYGNKESYNEFSTGFKGHSQDASQALGDKFSSNRDKSFHDSSRTKLSRPVRDRFYEDSGRVENAKEIYNLDHKEAIFKDYAQQSMAGQKGNYNLDRYNSAFTDNSVFTDAARGNNEFNRLNDVVNTKGNLIGGSRIPGTLNDGIRGRGFSVRGGVSNRGRSGFHEELSECTSFHGGSRRVSESNDGPRIDREFNGASRRSGEFNEGFRRGEEFYEGSERSRVFNEELRRGGEHSEGLKMGREFNEELRRGGEFIEGLRRDGEFNELRRGSAGINDGIRGEAGRLNDEIKRGGERLNNMSLPRIGAGFNDELRRGGLRLNDGPQGARELDRLRRRDELDVGMSLPTLSQRAEKFNPNMMQGFPANEKWGVSDNFRGGISSTQERGGLREELKTGFDFDYGHNSGSRVLEPSSRGSIHHVQFSQNFKDNIRNQEQGVFPQGSKFNISAYESIVRNDNKMEGNRAEMYPESTRNFVNEEYSFRPSESSHSNFAHTHFEQSPSNQLQHDAHTQDHLRQSRQSAYHPGETFDSNEFLMPDDISSSSHTSPMRIGNKTEDERIHKILLRKKKRLLLARAKLNPTQEKARANLEKEMEEVEMILREIGTRLYEERQKARLLRTPMQQF